MEDYLFRVEKAVAKRERWAVAHDEVHLNFFSFSKLLIYKDLDAETWPGGSQPADHPLVQQLFGGDGFAQGCPISARTSTSTMPRGWRVSIRSWTRTARRRSRFWTRSTVATW